MKKDQFALSPQNGACSLKLLLAVTSLTLPLVCLAETTTPASVTVTRLSPEQAAKLGPLVSTIKDRAQQRAAIEPESGRLRPHEHDDSATDAMAKTAEIAKRNSSTSSMAAQTAGKIIYHPSGAVGRRFDPDFLSFARASVNKQGQLTAECEEGTHADHEEVRK